jgi:hypothetical protein
LEQRWNTVGTEIVPMKQCLKEEKLALVLSNSNHFNGCGLAVFFGTPVVGKRVL